MVGDKPWPQVALKDGSLTNTGVLIIGAGLSGICTAIDLVRRNHTQDFIIVEKSGGVGGVWHDNRYPGCCCDIWSALYSFSFEQNPDWSREYPGQEELLQYIVNIAQQYNIFQHVRFGTTVEEATWDEEQLKWRTHVTVASGIKDSESNPDYDITSDFIVSAVGQLNQPQWPDIKGLDQFKGKKMHSARWDWSYDLKDKRVALLGNGCSSVQILPEITDVVKHVTIFQRTPNYVVPRLDRPIPVIERQAYKYFPPLLWLKRTAMMNFRESLHTLLIDSESRNAQETREVCLKAIKDAFPDDIAVQQKLTPKYVPGAKRIIISDDYYPALAKENVTLETRPIENISEHGIIVAEDGKQSSLDDIDVLVCATGFKTVDFLHPIKFTGRHGRSLRDTWKDGARALYGVTAEDMPNFAMLYGPNTNLGHSSIVLMIEAQSRYISGLVKPVLEAKRKGEQLALWPKKQVLDAYNERIQKVLRKSAWNDPSCQSWYRNKAGLITNNWSGTVVEYQKLLSEVNFKDFELEGSTESVERQPIAKIGRVVEETDAFRAVAWLGAVSTGVLALGWALRHSQYVRQLSS